MFSIEVVGVVNSKISLCNFELRIISESLSSSVDDEGGVVVSSIFFFC